MRKGARKRSLDDRIEEAAINSLKWLFSAFSSAKIFGNALDELIDEVVWRFIRSGKPKRLAGSFLKWPLSFFAIILLLTMLAIFMERFPAFDDLTNRDKSIILLAIIGCITTGFFVWSLVRAKKDDGTDSSSKDSQSEPTLRDILTQNDNFVAGEGKATDSEKVEELDRITLFTIWHYIGAALLVLFLVLFVGKKFFFGLGILISLGILFWSIGTIRKRTQEKKAVVFPGMLSVVSFVMIIGLSYLMFRREACDPLIEKDCKVSVSVSSTDSDPTLGSKVVLYPLPDKLPPDTSFIIVAKHNVRGQIIVVPEFYSIRFKRLNYNHCYYVVTGTSDSTEFCPGKRPELVDPERVRLSATMPETKIKVRLCDYRVSQVGYPPCPGPQGYTTPPVEINSTDTLVLASQN